MAPRIIKSVYMCLAAPFRREDNDQILLLHLTEVMCQAKILLFVVNCRLKLACLGEKWESYEANRLCKSDFGTTCNDRIYSLNRPERLLIKIFGPRKWALIRVERLLNFHHF